MPIDPSFKIWLGIVLPEMAELGLGGNAMCVWYYSRSTLSERGTLCH